MNDQTIALVISRIRRGLIEIVFQRNTPDLWRLPHVDVRNDLRSSGTILQWLATRTSFTKFAKVGELQDELAPQRFTHLFVVHDPDEPAEDLAWHNIHEYPDLAFMNERHFFDKRTREITELIIAHQNPYKLKAGFR